jgi:hypothetical protein
MIVYTVIFNDYDRLQQPRHIEGARFVCFTDRVPANPGAWEVQIIDRAALNPFAQRAFKILSHRVFPDSEVTLYLDGTFELTADPLEIAGELLARHDMALFRHPQRQGVYAELEACADLGKEEPEIVAHVADRYRLEGMPDDGYLHAAGFILRRHTEQVASFNEMWFDELRATSVRDQPALAHTLWMSGLPLETIEEDIWKSDLMVYHAHRSRTESRERSFVFMCGNPRSGTTALCDLLNNDPRMVIGMERYRRIRGDVSPEHFTKERFFSPTPAETTYVPRRLLPSDDRGFKVWPRDEESTREKWESPQLKYVGDKSPFYVLELPYLRGAFPGARFVVALRDPVAVADSYQRRAEDPDDHWPLENDYRLAVDHWNESLTALHAYLREFGLADVFLVDYDTFFSGDAAYLRSLFQFLEMAPDDRVLFVFEQMTRDWAKRIRRPASLSAEMEAEVRSRADWDRYAAVRRLLPLMRDYELLDLERGRWLAKDIAAESYQEAFGRLFDLSREWLTKARAFEATEAESPGVAAFVDATVAMWHDHWQVAELGRPTHDDVENPVE